MVQKIKKARKIKKVQKIKPFKKEKIPAFFKDSFFVADRGSIRKAIALPIALVVHVSLVAAIIIIPLLNTGELPQIEIYSAFLAPPPPVPPPPPPPPKKRKPSGKRTRIRPVQTKTAVTPGKLVAPVEIPEDIAEEELSEIGVEGGVVGGVEGGVVGGVLGGVVGGVLGGVVGDSESPVRAYGEIRPPKLIKEVNPIYPEIARQARVEGIVILEATTDTYGRVQTVKVLRGVPLLETAAIDAVRQWVYEPMIINGRPRGFIFVVRVTFRLK